MIELTRNQRRIYRFFILLLLVLHLESTRRYRNTVDDLQEQINALRSQLAAERLPKEASSASSASDAHLPEAPQQTSQSSVEEPKQSSPSAKRSSEQLPERPNEIFGVGMKQAVVEMQLRELESSVVITDEQRERLRELFAGKMTDSLGLLAGESPEKLRAQMEESANKLKEILGQEKFDAYQAAQHQSIQNLRNEQFQAKVSALTSKLKLNSKQVLEVSSELRLVDQAVSDDREQWIQRIGALKTDEAGNPKVDMPLLMSKSGELLEHEKEFREQELSRRLKTVLTEDQYNTLLESLARGDLFPRLLPDF
ncbi:MAG: hypothetical protein U0136_20275 [Bdellovibrionota bacterium]